MAEGGQLSDGVVNEISGGTHELTLQGGVFGQFIHEQVNETFHADSATGKPGHPVKPGVFRISDVVSLRENKPLSISSRVFHAILHSDVTGDKIVVAKITPADERHQREAKIHFSVPRHENIVERIATDIFNFRGQPSIYIAMECCDCNLDDHIKSQVRDGVPFGKKKYLSISRQIVVGLKFLHSHNVVHGDLKPGNVLLILVKNIAKLCDFGLSRTISGDKTSTQLTSPQGGTTGWLAPEVLEGTTKLGFKNDIFPLGLMAFYCWSYGKHPYGDKPVSWNHYIVKGENRNLDGMLIPDADAAKVLLGLMLEQNPTDRPTAEEVLKSGIFSFEATSDLEPSRAVSPCDSPTRVSHPTLHDLSPPPAQSLAASQLLGSASDQGLPSLGTMPEMSEVITHQDEPLNVETDSGDVTIPANKVKELKEHDGVVFRCSWNPTCDLLASCSSDSTARIWDLTADAATGALPRGLVLQYGDRKPVWGLDWKCDGTLLATGSDDGYARIWTKDGRLLHQLHQHSGPIRALNWNKQGNYIVSGSNDKTAIIWDAQSGKLKTQFCFHDDEISDIDWMDDVCFASCSRDGNIHVCRLGCKKPVKTFKGHCGHVNSVKWDSSKMFLASGSNDWTVKIWSMKQGNFIHDLRGHNGPVWNIRWSPTGPGSQNPNQKLLLASASYDKTVRLWEPEHEACLHKLKHQDWVRSIAFSPDGKLLASGSNDQCVKIWNTQSGHMVRSYEGTGEIRDVSWNAAGTKLAAGVLNGTVVVLDLRK